MADTETYAKREVAGGELHLRRHPGARWEISRFERCLNAPTAMMEGMLRWEELSPQHFEGKTFATPEEAVAAIQPLVARRSWRR